MLFKDEDKSGGSDRSYIPSDDDGKIDVILSYTESNYDSSSDGEDVGGLPTDASTLKSCDGKECWSIALIISCQGGIGSGDRNLVCENSGPTRPASRLCSSTSDCFFLFFQTNFLEEICK